MKKKGLKVFVCILIAIVLVAGGALALSFGIRNVRAVAKLGDVTVDSGTVTYLASLYKKTYFDQLVKEGIEYTDSEEFWDSEKADGLSYRKDFENSFKSYLDLLVADGYLYVTNCGYSPEDKIKVAEKGDAVIRKYANGSVSEFNEVAEKYGFDHNDFQNANALIYKAERARELLPTLLGEAEYEEARLEAVESISYNSYYPIVDLHLSEIPVINDYYVE